LLGSVAASAADPVAALGFNPEKLTDYEGGLKTTLFDNRVRLNVAGFYYDYTDLQVQQIYGTTLITANAASAHIYGAEAELTAALTRALTIDGNASWLHARYVKYIGPQDLPPFGSADFSGTNSFVTDFRYEG